ncbi:MAG: DUF5935 domain-containing protein [Rhodopila sp.]
MLRSIWLVSLYVAFLGMALPAPFVATLGYVWVDTFQPQFVAYYILNEVPVAMVMGGAALGLYILMDRRSPPPLCAETMILFLLMGYITLSLTWSVVSEPAWSKWDLTFKMLLFAAFIPYSIRTRVQIEAFTNTYVFSLAANFVPFGLKTLISGGGYGTNLGLQGQFRSGGGRPAIGGLPDGCATDNLPGQARSAASTAAYDFARILGRVIAHPNGALSQRKWQEHHWAPSVRLEADWPCGQACVRGD